MNLQEKLIWDEIQGYVDESCLVCGNKDNNVSIIHAKHWHDDVEAVNFAKCHKCSSVWTLEADKKILPYPSPDETINDSNFKYLIYHYLEIVNGLDWKSILIGKLKNYQFNSILEVGCNVGVTLDFCSSIWPNSTIRGVEPSAYGLFGKKELSLPIINSYLDESNLKNNSFDFIYATEVIEHVEKPKDFLESLKKKLSTDGVIMLTTPRSEILNNNTPPGELYAALSPGAHYFILSKNQLRKIIKESGFEFYHIEEFGITHVIYLSKKPISLINNINTSKLIEDYYLINSKKKYPDKRILLGNLINLYISKQEHDTDLSKKIDDILNNLFNFSLANTKDLKEKISLSNTIFDFGKNLPYSLPFYLYKRSEIEESDLNILLSTALNITLHGLRVDFQNMFVYHNLMKKIENKKLSMHTLEESKKIKEKIIELRKEKISFFKKLKKAIKIEKINIFAT